MTATSGLKAQLESILFAAGKAVSLQDLQKLCKAEPDNIKAALADLAQDYTEHNSSLMLVEEGDSYKLTVREQYLPLVKDVVSETELPKSIMETLAVIAFKHPILQAELVKIRSNKAYDHLNELEQTGYIKREAYGRTKKIHLTQKFFDYFDLPPNKVKEAFASFDAVSREIEKQEAVLEDQLHKRQERRAEEKRQTEEERKLGQLDVYETAPDEPEEKPTVLQVYDTTTMPLGNVEVIRGDDSVKQPELPLDSARHEVLAASEDESEEEDDYFDDSEGETSDEDAADSDEVSADSEQDEEVPEQAEDGPEPDGEGSPESEDPDASKQSGEPEGSEDSAQSPDSDEELSPELSDEQPDFSFSKTDPDKEGDDLLEKRIKAKEEALLGKDPEEKKTKRDEAFDSISQDIEEQKDVLGK
ncbi:MAG: SMC-Scp complex subunit ScpB [Nanobdellota archaeon]